MTKDRIDRLRELRDALYTRIFENECDARSLAGLAKQYRETLLELEEMEKQIDDTDEVGQLLARRAKAGKSKPVR